MLNQGYKKGLNLIWEFISHLYLFSVEAQDQHKGSNINLSKGLTGEHNYLSILHSSMLFQIQNASTNNIMIDIICVATMCQTSGMDYLHGEEVECEVGNYAGCDCEYIRFCFPHTSQCIFFNFTHFIMYGF